MSDFKLPNPGDTFFYDDKRYRFNSLISYNEKTGVFKCRARYLVEEVNVTLVVDITRYVAES